MNTPQPDSTFFPLIITYPGNTNCFIVSTPETLPIGQPFVVLRTQATDLDLEFASKLVEHIRNCFEK